MSEGSEEKSWTAVHDFMPPGSGLLSVRGKCTFPTPGYKVVLTKAVPQGVNKEVLILNKVVTPPSQIEPQIVTTVRVEYYEVTREHYSEVEIVPDGVRIKVEEVH